MFLVWWLPSGAFTLHPGSLSDIWKGQTTWPASWEICMQVKKWQLEPDMEQQTGSKLEKEYVKAVHCHLAYLAYMQSTSCKMPGWMNHKLESRLPGEISITSDTFLYYCGMWSLGRISSHCVSRSSQSKQHGRGLPNLYMEIGGWRLKTRNQAGH